MEHFFQQVGKETTHRGMGHGLVDNGHEKEEPSFIYDKQAESLLLWKGNISCEVLSMGSIDNSGPSTISERGEKTNTVLYL